MKGLARASVEGHRMRVKGEWLSVRALGRVSVKDAELLRVPHLVFKL